SAIIAGDMAGRTRERRWRMLAAYLLALALPLHLSALVAAPVVIYIAWRSDDDFTDSRSAIELAGVTTFIVGASRLSLVIAAVGFLMSIAATFVSRAPRSSSALAETLGTVAAVAVACSA